MERVKGKGKASDLTPEALGAGGGNPRPPGRRRATRGSRRRRRPDDEEEGSGQKPDESRKGKRDERPTPQGEGDYEAANDEQFKILSRAMTNALGQRTRVPAEPPCPDQK